MFTFFKGNYCRSFSFFITKDDYIYIYIYLKTQPKSYMSGEVTSVPVDLDCEHSIISYINLGATATGGSSRSIKS